MFKKSIAWYLVCAIFLIAIVPRVEAGFVPSHALASHENQRSADLGKIKNILETKLVTQRLQDLGFNSEEVKDRLSILSDEQLHHYAQQLDDLRPGGDGLGAVIGILIIIILVLVVLHLTGHKVIIQ